MNLSLRSRALILLVLLSAALAYMIAQKQYTLNTGQLIVLETIPIDPRSLFRGDYVRLNYDISELRLDELGGEQDFSEHAVVYVELIKQGKYWKPIAIFRQAPQREGLFIKGDVKYVKNYWWNPRTRQSEQRPSLTVRYGIENYFVPEGEGRALERPAPGEQIDMLIAVDKYGRAGIKGVLVNDQLRYEEKLF